MGSSVTECGALIANESVTPQCDLGRLRGWIQARFVRQISYPTLFICLPLVLNVCLRYSAVDLWNVAQVQQSLHYHNCDDALPSR